MKGRRGYDNWLVQYALKNNISVIDTTNTLLALHQTGKEGNHEGHHHSNVNYNMELLKPFPASLGKTPDMNI